MKRAKLALAAYTLAALGLLAGCNSKGSSSAAPPPTDSEPAALAVKAKLKFDSVPNRPDGAKALEAAGSNCPELLYRAWFQGYQANVKVAVKYDPVGSTVALQRLGKGTIDFAGVDVSLNEEQLKAVGQPVIHIPTALGAVAICYNVPELQNSDVVLTLTAENLAAIFSGEIKSWNDPALVANNPALRSVEQAIITVHRADASGTSYVFSDYLSTVDKRWEQRIGRGFSVSWPVGVSAEMNAGVAGEVKRNEYSIGYVDNHVAIQYSLPSAAVRNQAGTFVGPTVAAIAAAGNAVAVPDDLRFNVLNSPAKDAYPICTATWIVCPKDVKESRKSLAMCDLLWWVTHEGQVANSDLRFAPLPQAVTIKSEALIKSLTSNGTQTLPGK